MQEIIEKFPSSLLVRLYRETWLTASELRTIWNQAKFLARKQHLRRDRFWAATYRIAENLAKKKLGKVNVDFGEFPGTSHRSR